MTVAALRPLFKALREQLVPLVDAIAARPAPDNSFIYRDYVEQQQWDFGVDIVRRYGYDFERGRQDKTHHPFMIRFSAGDVRITTRFSKNNLIDGLFSTLHEAGHAMYEQGVAAGLRRYAAGTRRILRRPREPVAPVGERGGAQPALLGLLLPAAAGCVPAAVGRCRARTRSTAPSTWCGRA